MIFKSIRWFFEKFIGMHVHTWGEWIEAPNGVKVYSDIGGYQGIYRGWTKTCETCGKRKVKV